MDFMGLLRSLEGLVYELVVWIVLYPLTMWRSVIHPQAMMRYADSELGDAQAEQYVDTLSPPIFLLLTLLLAHILEEGLIPGAKASRPSFIAEDKDLLIFRAVAFSLFPLLMALNLLRNRHIKIDRKTLKSPFYSQCYVTAPFAFAFDAGLILLQLPGTAIKLSGLAVVGLALVWFVAVEARWFANCLPISLGRGVWIAFLAVTEGLMGILAIALVVGLIWHPNK